MRRLYLAICGTLALISLGACAQTPLATGSLSTLRPALSSSRSAGQALNTARHGRGAGAYTFDHFNIGASFADVVARAPYEHPCDTDPIDHRQRMLVLYTAKDCRGSAFPEATTAVFLLNFQADNPMQATIASFAYLGGSYFHERTDFPIRIGTSLPETGIGGFASVLGEPLSQERQLGSPARPLQVARFGADIYVLHDRAKVVGIVAGAMPDDVTNEQWKVVYSMWPRPTR